MLANVFSFIKLANFAIIWWLFVYAFSTSFSTKSLFWEYQFCISVSTTFTPMTQRYEMNPVIQPQWNSKQASSCTLLQFGTNYAYIVFAMGYTGFTDNHRHRILNRGNACPLAPRALTYIMRQAHAHAAAIERRNKKTATLRDAIAWLKQSALAACPKLEFAARTSRIYVAPIIWVSERPHGAQRPPHRVAGRAPKWIDSLINCALSAAAAAAGQHTDRMSAAYRPGMCLGCGVLSIARTDAASHRAHHAKAEPVCVHGVCVLYIWCDAIARRKYD